MERMIDQLRRERLKDSNLEDIYRKIGKGKRLSREDGVRLFESDDILSIGAMANRVRERLNGDHAYYIINQHINPTNVCVNQCRFCAFSRKKNEEGSYTFDLEEVLDRVKERLHDHITEIHLVGGLHPDLSYDYYLEMIEKIKNLRPDVHIQGFTAVEIAYLGEISEKSEKEVLEELTDAGLGSLPGGGAEVLNTDIRKKICSEKQSPADWLNVHRKAHEMGIRSNATLLFGHVETAEERIDHMLKLRDLQDETGGFMSFIPLAFHSGNTEFENLSGPSGFDCLRTLAVSRLMLDNFDHIKAFWIMMGTKMAQVSLSFGVDDIDGTVIEERITHMAGATTKQELTREELENMIEEAGRTPVERDTLYNEVKNERSETDSGKLH